MRIGKLDQRVTIQRAVNTTGSGGGVTKTWATVATVWAHVISQRGDESFRAAAERARHTVKVLVRYRAGVTPAMRLVWNGQNYDVVDVDESLRRSGELWLMATAEVQ